MIQLGSSDAWIDLLDPLIPGIVDLVAETWPTLKQPAGDELEDVMTKALCRALRSSRAARALPLQIHLQFVEIDSAVEDDEGRIDITFLPIIPREDIYFALECKRLNVRQRDGKIRPCHAEYVQNGMMRFIAGRYGAAVHAGGMLGYVLDGQVGQAIAGVAANVQQHHATLEMDAPGELSASSLRPKDDNARETRHRSSVRSYDFCIHHLFVACDPTTPLRQRRSTRPARPASRRGNAGRKNLARGPQPNDWVVATALSQCIGYE